MNINLIYIYIYIYIYIADLCNYLLSYNFVASVVGNELKMLVMQCQE
jgi:hypothetical protein